MEEIKQPNNAPVLMLCPAFRVENGIITQVNDAAAAYAVQIGTDITKLIHIGIQEFSEFTQGRLDLTLSVENTLFNASVFPDDTGYTFCLDSDFVQPELRAFSLAAQQLREPLSNAIISAEGIPENADHEARSQLSHIRRNLQQMMRILCNMSDVAGYSANANLQTRNVVSVFEDVLEKAKSLLEKANKHLQIQLPQQPIFCGADEKMLERAVLNLLSNAATFSADGDTINISLFAKKQRLYFSVENNCRGENSQNRDLFARYLREPVIEEGRNGIGLGLPIVRAVAAAHGGTVLMDQPKSGTIRTTMTISLQAHNTPSLRSAIQIPYDYSGGWDHCLMELSGVLPAELYED